MGRQGALEGWRGRQGAPQGRQLGVGRQLGALRAPVGAPLGAPLAPPFARRPEAVASIASASYATEPRAGRYLNIHAYHRAIDLLGDSSLSRRTAELHNS